MTTLNWGYRLGAYTLYAPNGAPYATLGERFDAGRVEWGAVVFVHIAGTTEPLLFGDRDEARTFIEASYLMQFGG
jgi:hypothetical protein